MEGFSCARFFDHAVEVSIVPVIRRVLYFQIILAEGRKAFNPESFLKNKNVMFGDMIGLCIIHNS